jgi:predicted transcriptional regulator
LVAAPAVGAEASVPLSFQVPAEFGHAGNATNLQWALLVFHGATAQATLQAPGPSRSINHTALFYGTLLPNATGAHYGNDLPDQAQDHPALQADLAFSGSEWSSLYVQADAIEVAHQDVEDNALALAAGQPFGAAMSDPAPPPTAFRALSLTAPSDGAALNFRSPTLGQAFPFTLHATGVHAVEWTNARTQCNQTPCPDGARSQETRADLPGGNRAVVRRLSFMQLTTGNATLDGAGRAVNAAVGGRSIDLQESGAVRLPFTARTAPCPSSCLEPANRTLALSGAVELRGLQFAGDGRLSATVSGNIGAARLDETAVSPLLFGTVPATVAIGAGLVLAGVLAKFLWRLFSREIDPEDALKNHRRRQLYDAILAHPGATYRFLMQATGQSDGGTRHHLAALQRLRLVAVQRHEGTLRYYENHGRYDQTWRREALLRDPHLRQVVEWVAQHPGRNQRAIIQHAEAAWAWSGKVTRQRLARLARWGLLVARRDGRSRLYTVAA